METQAALEAYSRGDMSAIELRRRLGGATHGEVLALLSEHNLPPPRAPRQAARSRSNARGTGFSPSMSGEATFHKPINPPSFPAYPRQRGRP